MLHRIPQLWGRDSERCFNVIRTFVAPTVMALAPGTRAYGVDRVPLEGGLVLAANHFSGLDHPLIGVFSPRPIHYMAKAELIEMPIIGELLSWTGAFPVRRGEGDREALRWSRQIVRDGGIVGLHVEGTRQRLGYPGPVKIGAMMIAMQEGARVLPCAVDTFRWSLENPRPCAVVWGEPMTLDGLRRNREGYEKGMEIISAEILRLWRLACEAVANGMPPELSDGARRYLSYPPFQLTGTLPVPDP